MIAEAVGIAFGAITPLGRGEDALSSGAAGEAPVVCVEDDGALLLAGLARPAAARIAGAPGQGTPAAATALLLSALDACLAALPGALPGFRALRVGLVLGTSSGGMPAAERVYLALARGEPPPEASAQQAAYGAPFEAALGALGSLGLSITRSAQLLGACASSTLALGVAQAWLSIGACDLVLAGGYDAITTFVASGFASLGATTRTRPAPFRRGRDGLALGEGAAVVALVRAGESAAPPCLCVSGFGASTDAVHITAPDRTGAGVAAAASRAFAAAGLDPAEADLVSAHGTATAFNDAAEARALVALFGERAASVPVHAMKGEVGHLCGAAGVVEALSAGRALITGVTPGSGGQGPVDPEAAVRVLDRGLAHPARVALKLSSAFGGLNAALVLRARPALRPRATQVERASVLLPAEGFALGEPALGALSEALGVPVDRLARTDGLTRLLLGAMVDLSRQVGRDAVASAGLLVGHDVATQATNARFAQRLAERGPRGAEPRRFPYTSPNACVGEAALAFGIHGPSFAVGGSPGLEGQALVLARDLLSSGLASAWVVAEVSERSAAGDLLFAARGRLPPERSFARARLLVAADRLP